MKKYFSTKRIAFLAVLTAMTALTTLVIRIPGAFGYFNVGDTVILMAAAMFDPIFAMIVGGLGSAIADLIGGYAIFAIPTLIIKGLEGLVAGLIIRSLRKMGVKKLVAYAFGMAIGVLFMAGGYFVANWILYSFGAAVTSAPIELTQAGVSLVLGVLIACALSKVRAITNFVDFARDEKPEEGTDEKNSNDK